MLASKNGALTALRLTVNNHPGVMSHVCGLFARRAFNMEGILVTPINGSGKYSSMWLLVNQDERLEQMVLQVRKLHDVLEVQTVPLKNSAFDALRACMESLETAQALGG